MRLGHLFRGRLFTSLRGCASPVPKMVPALRGLHTTNVGVKSAANCAHRVVSMILPTTRTGKCHISCYTAPGLLPTKHPTPCVVFRGLAGLTVPDLSTIVGINSAVTSVHRKIGTGICDMNIVLNDGRVTLARTRAGSVPTSRLRTHVTSIGRHVLTTKTSCIVHAVRRLPTLVRAVGTNGWRSHPRPAVEGVGVVCLFVSGRGVVVGPCLLLAPKPLAASRAMGRTVVAS